jgi:hypothetical protein
VVGQATASEPAAPPEMRKNSARSRNPGTPLALPSGMPRRIRRRWVRIALLLAVPLAAILLTGGFANEPLRGLIERRMNRALDGYAVEIQRVEFHPAGLAVQIEGLKISQRAHPSPPVAEVERLRASVQWSKLVRGAVVADFAIERPAIYLDRTQVEREATDERPVDERGWQDALQAMYPLKINELTIEQGSLTYADRGPFEPLRLSEVEFRATNIRNIEDESDPYPSTVYLECAVFERGRLGLSGRANFLSKPHPSVKAAAKLDDLALAYLKPVTTRYNVDVRDGWVSGAGQFEFNPQHTSVHLTRAEIQGVDADYVHTASTAPREQQRAKAAARAAEDSINEPGLVLRIDHLRMTGSQIAFVNQAAEPDYKLFLADAELTLENLSNRFEAGPMQARLTGRFQGSGGTLVTAVFRPETHGPDFGLDVRVNDTDMRKLNPLLRAYGGIDVARGSFSVYSEVSIREGRIDGYVKPLFRDLDVLSEEDSNEGMLKQLYEGLAGGVAGLLKNDERDEVATKTDLTGRVDQPNTSTVQVVVRLVQNAFFKAILPGLDREARRGTS